MTVVLHDVASSGRDKMRTALEKKGRSVGANDLLIGAHALNERRVLVNGRDAATAKSRGRAPAIS